MAMIAAETDSSQVSGGFNPVLDGLQRFLEGAPIVAGSRCVCILAGSGIGELDDFIDRARRDRVAEKVFEPVPDDEYGSILGFFGSPPFRVSFRRYQMEYRDTNFFTKCPVIVNRENGRSVHVMPWYQTPYHPYPVFVPLFGCMLNMYCGYSCDSAAVEASRLFETGISHMAVHRCLVRLDSAMRSAEFLAAVFERAPVPGLDAGLRAAHRYLTDDAVALQVDVYRAAMMDGDEGRTRVPKPAMRAMLEAVGAEVLRCCATLKVAPARIREAGAATAARERRYSYRPRRRTRPLPRGDARRDARRDARQSAAALAERMVIGAATVLHRLLN